MSWHVFLNVILFQGAWFAAVLGASKGVPWLGPLMTIAVGALHLSINANKNGEIRLLLISGVIGFLFDSLLIATEVFRPVPHLYPPPWSPPWMVSLWLNFAMTLNVSLAWLKHRYLLAALFGAVGGPLAYLSGAKLGATETVPSSNGLLILAIGWLVITPLLVFIAEKTSYHMRCDQKSTYP